MKNKKSMSVPGLITTFAISLLLLFIFVGPIIKDIFIDQQVAYAGGKTEEITIDCDGDNVIGFKDHCPCAASKQELKSGDPPCGNPDSKAGDICPKLCKK